MTDAKKNSRAKIKFRFIRGFIFAVLLFAFYVPSPASGAHRYHTSLTLIDYKPVDQNIEITIKLFTHDLEKVLQNVSRKRIDLEKTPGIDKIIHKYLEENFILKNKKDEKLIFQWVGKEFDADMTLVYLETGSAESIEGFRLQNTIFFESFVKQTNLVTARFEDKKADLMYKRGDKFKEIEVIKTEEEK